MATVSTEEKQFILMTKTPMGKLIASLAVPTVISTLVTAIYNITDTFYVAHLGASAAGAVGIVFSLMGLIQALGMGVGMGAASLISRRLGERNQDAASKYLSSAFFFGIGIGCTICVLGHINLDGLMRLLGSTETILPYAHDYATYILRAAPFMCGAFVLNTALRSEGKAFFAMIGLGTGTLLNVGVAPLFIFVFNWGISGAAIAVWICQTISLLILLSFYLRGKSVCSLSFKRVSFQLIDYWDLIRLGFPTTLRQGCASLAMALLNAQAALFGDVAVAAISITMKIYMGVRGIVLGIGQAMQPVAGYNHGAKLYDRVRQSFWVTTRAGTTLCLLFAIIFYIWAEPVVAIFKTGNPEVIRLGVETLHFFCIAMPFLAYSTYVNQLLQILGQSKSAMFLAACRQGIMFVPLIFILPHYFGRTGVEATQAGADILTFFVSIPFLVYFFRSYDRLQTKDEKTVTTSAKLIHQLANKSPHWEQSDE